MFKNVKIGKRLMIGFSIVTFIALLLGTIGFYGARKYDESVHRIGDVLMPKVQNLMLIAQQGERASAAMRTLAVSGLPKEVRQKQYENLEQARTTYQKAREEYREFPRTEEEARLWSDYQEASQAWWDQNESTIKTARQLDDIEDQDSSRAKDIEEELQDEIFGATAELQNEAVRRLNQLQEMNMELAGGEIQDSYFQSNFMKGFSLIAMVIGVLLAAGLGFFITRSITRPVRRIVDGLESSSDQVASASQQVASSSQSQAEGASEQASSLEETSSSLEEISGQTRQNANNAEQAETAMKESAEIVENGVASMEKMNSAITEIKESSKETSRIIKTIDDIAFQTNLLALNAAVEAARAGEAGKGFAVVAEEVRNLAQRSAEAANDTSQLIEKSQQNADNGVSVAEEAAEQFNSIKESSGKIKTLVGEIAAASKEQAQGIDQVNTAVSEMDKVVQQNAADSEESASAAEELSSQAQELTTMVAELEAMVGSSRNGNTKENKVKGRAQSQGNGKQVSKKIAPSPEKPSKEAGSLANSKRKNNSKADQVIPLDDDEFKDF